eukprot:TRINITY_DN19013_c0_g1_i1.p1 TRINITY_DN19013_c0_g1~~TRINITY_DN19013_c0_g1_i1.p1  ORF type:complete len:176 (+),score=41.49 TRINITY_DN19013_c0_g1_i1:68-595(+)
MGSASSTLTQYDIEAVQLHSGSKFSQREIVSLYERFCALDRNGKGYISGDEFMAVPEFALNPLSQRLLRLFEGVNFKDFVAILSAFSTSGSADDKIKFIFRVYDSDGNGKVSRADILVVLRDLSGSFLTEEQRQQVVTRALEEAGFAQDCVLTLADFKKVLSHADLKMGVDVPLD